MVSPASWPVLFAFLYNPGDLGYIPMGCHFSQDSPSFCSNLDCTADIMALTLWTVWLLLYSSHECWFCFCQEAAESLLQILLMRGVLSALAGLLR